MSWQASCFPSAWNVLICFSTFSPCLFWPPLSITIFTSHFTDLVCVLFHWQQPLCHWFQMARFWLRLPYDSTRFQEVLVIKTGIQWKPSWSESWWCPECTGGCNDGPSHWPLLTQNITSPIPSCYQAMAIKLMIKSAIQTSCICCLDLVLCKPSCDTPWHSLWFSSSLDALLKDSLDPVLLSILGGCPFDVVTLVLDAVSERRDLK